MVNPTREGGKGGRANSRSRRKVTKQQREPQAEKSATKTSAAASAAAAAALDEDEEAGDRVERSLTSSPPKRQQHEKHQPRHQKQVVGKEPLAAFRAFRGPARVANTNLQACLFYQVPFDILWAIISLATISSRNVGYFSCRCCWSAGGRFKACSFFLFSFFFWRGGDGGVLSLFLPFFLCCSAPFAYHGDVSGNRKPPPMPPSLLLPPQPPPSPPHVVLVGWL